MRRHELTDEQWNDAGGEGCTRMNEEESASGCLPELLDDDCVQDSLVKACAEADGNHVYDEKRVTRMRA